MEYILTRTFISITLSVLDEVYTVRILQAILSKISINQIASVCLVGIWFKRLPNENATIKMKTLPVENATHCFERVLLKIVSNNPNKSELFAV